MKKSFTSIALFSLVVLATSFTTPEVSNQSDSFGLDIFTDGNQSAGGGRKQDFRIPTDGNQSSGGGRKQDVYSAGDQVAISLGTFSNSNQSTGNSRKID
ncbi:hypothetical protein QWY99_19505 [Flavobacterium branchiarum]|uniref:Uncharacterized protein n=1 Tax=Flavobacterium branchiarum TaxID=1114870 RepID=A0ABV5FKS3_9FLAO|nr:hypothetical protein [Flavobacterium branchiarum]MDN3675226.1 hypothetical protein [Flavobacterium branchiarum]